MNKLIKQEMSKIKQSKPPKLVKINLTRKEKELADNLLEIGAFKFGNFKLKLHREHPNAPLSPVYIDLRLLRRYPRAKKIAIDVFEELIKEVKFDLLADVPTAGSPFTSSLSDRLMIGMVTPRIDKKEHGSGARIDGLGPRDKGKTVLLVDDLITTSTSKLEAANFFKLHGMKVKDVVVLIDREQGGKAQLKKNKIKLHFSLTLDRLLDYYLSSKKISQKEYDEIHKKIDKLTNYLKD